ncbi:MAG TPA: hypothetical protein ENH11_01140 [Candidatus Acetothermia bacterium]|nr:hypothetical protein [Candidatus Acetothermia bacterium]
MGRLTDPAKIAAKQEEWEQTAATEAIANRLTSQISEFAFATLDGQNSYSGTGARELIKLLLDLDKSSDKLVIFGLGARRRLSQAALEYWADNGEDLIPRKFWKFPYMDDKGDEVVFDPMSMIRWSGEEYADVFTYFGFPGVTRDRSPLPAQIQVGREMTKKILAI